MPQDDLYRVTVIFTDENGHTDETRAPVEKALRPLGLPENDVETTARAIWREAGSPRHCHVSVQLVGPYLAEYAIEDGIWEETHRNEAAAVSDPPGGPKH